MWREQLTQVEIDKLVVVERIDAEPTVFGVGLNDTAFRPTIKGRQIWQSVLWRGMLGRCFSEKIRSKHPTYGDATCCTEWLSFANFLEWCNKEVGYSGFVSGTNLDKDILVAGNKKYSPLTCCLVPRQINTLLLDNKSNRGDWPVGVIVNRYAGRFQARIKRCGVISHIGHYDTPEEAFLAYKTAKEAHVKIVATQHRDSIKPAVYEALMN